MNKTLLMALVWMPLLSSGATFTHDTWLDLTNASFDGEDIVVTNCMLTVDGTHGFASVRVLNGGRITHTGTADGMLAGTLTVVGETCVLSGTSAAMLVHSNVIGASVVVRDAGGGVTYTRGLDYDVIATNEWTWIELLPGSAITEASINLVDYQYLGLVPAGMTLMVGGDVVVEAGGRIDVDGKGYGGGSGPGAGPAAGAPLSGSGGGHGGCGGGSAGQAKGGECYDTPRTPVMKGSGGGSGGSSGSGGAGGGMVKLVVGGILRVEGSISANGAPGISARSGGGAGGSLWLVASNVVGAGRITADGGSGELPRGGGGAGGCIAVQSSALLYTGQMFARGGGGYECGGAGTVCTEVAGAVRQLVLDNGGRAGWTRLSGESGYRLVIRDGAWITPMTGLIMESLLVDEGGWLIATNRVRITVTGNATVAAGGGIIADEGGYAATQGPGPGRYASLSGFYSGGGGGHGGYGGSGGNASASGGNCYGYVSNPSDLGSGGGAVGPTALGSAGGGAIQLTVGGALVVHGRISANGGDGLEGGSGGGAGGSIWLTAGTLAGAGTISANGGSGDGFGLYAGGGGGGGRISIQSGLNLFFGNLAALGGEGRTCGGAGTIYLAGQNQRGQLIVDNGGRVGTNTAWYAQSTLDLTVRGGASMVLPSQSSPSQSSSSTLGSLLVASNSWLYGVGHFMTVLSNATIEAGGGIVVDRMGYLAGQGSGGGRYSTIGSGLYTGGGGGYGGYGGMGAASQASGGAGYGQVSQPSDYGSGGGGSVTSFTGGAGGGVLHLKVNGVLTVDGTVSANGEAGQSSGAGGGSGGSLWLEPAVLGGNGAILANGGDGIGTGGGGGGGRIAVTYGANLFNGTMQARGGGGGTCGGAGTIYLQVTKAAPQLIVDNGGQAGTNTYWPAVANIDLVLKGGAIGAPTSLGSFSSVLIGSNSWLLMPTNLDAATMTVASNLVIQAGGGLVGDGAGYGAGAGPGAGRYSSLANGYTAGGGGYGGYGASGWGSVSGSFGGIPYGSYLAPSEMGSGGGGSATSCMGGAGGGGMRLTVNGMLAVDGRLSVNGRPGVSSGSGGGSGGSLWLTVGSLAGQGIISANGGTGNGVGGGGGGGRIAVFYGANAFSGTLAAWGGSGNARGGAGTICLKANSSSTSRLLVDNGGQAGTNTAWQASGTSDLVLNGGGSMTLPSGGSTTLGNLRIGPGSRLWLTNHVLVVTGDATIEAEGGILADGSGNAGGAGYGAGRSSGAGGSYGGYGGLGSNSVAYAGGGCYGSVIQPADLGSGGASSTIGGPGGGAVRLTVTGKLDLDGRISANGSPAPGAGGGGGSGGSIWVVAGTLGGRGAISANGGDGMGAGGGGGGGRILIQSATNDFFGEVTARGGNGYNAGGAGTICTRPGDQAVAQLLVDNGGRLGTNTWWNDSRTFDLTIRNGGIGAPASGTIRNLLVASNGWLVVGMASMQITGNALVQAGGGITADGLGWTSNGGPGAGRYVTFSGSGFCGGGGGFGGYGAVGARSAQAYGGTAYGSLITPIDKGSAGAGPSPQYGGAGGGAVHLTVTGALAIDGQLSANGMPGPTPGGGGGAGGSLWLSVGTLSGTGHIAANGGRGNGSGGGGGGGRVAIQYSTNLFTGAISACGGEGGSGWGGAGTVYLKANSQAGGNVYADNGGHFGTNTLLPNLTSPFNLTVRNGAVVWSQSSSLTLSNLAVGAGGVLTFQEPRSGVDIEVLRDATIESNAAISLDGKGYSSMTGPGAGLTAYSIGSGAGYGGRGGASSVSPGGAIYGSSQQPFERGSAGGYGYFYGVPAGSEGGGALRLTVGRALILEGRVSADGNPGRQDDAGGGSGGSVWVNAGTLVGSGILSARGGEGELYFGGGGGGGRIAVYAKVNAFNGAVSVAGGDGYTSGEDGTVLVSQVPLPLFGVSHTPAGQTSAAVSSVDIAFNIPINPYSASAAGVELSTPSAKLASGDLAVQPLGPVSIRITFPLQTNEGLYTFSLGPELVKTPTGEPMAQAYTGTFSIAWPVVFGVVTDTNQQPLSNVRLETQDGAAAVTDTNGYYALKVPPVGTISVVPSLTGFVFIPSSRSYQDLGTSVFGQDYSAAASIMAAVGTRVQGGDLVLRWEGVAGVTYQPISSTNLVDWVPCGLPVPGTNAAMELAFPRGDSPVMFYRLQAAY